MDELRTCGTCHEQRPLAMFYLGIERRKAAKGKPNLMWCRPCHRAYLARRRQPRADYVDRIKRENGCADCGIHSEHTEIFDLDRRGSCLAVDGTWSYGGEPRPSSRDEAWLARYRFDRETALRLAAEAVDAITFNGRTLAHWDDHSMQPAAFQKGAK